MRHGQSTWNAAGRWQGWHDPPLSEDGEAQALEAAGALGDAGLTAVVHTGMQRAARTAGIAGALGLPTPEVAPGLKEYDVGEWGGLTRPEIEARWPGALDRWFSGTLPATPGGESRTAFLGRITSALHEVALTHPGGTVLVVSHGGVIGSLQRAALGEDGPRIANLSGRWFEVDDAGEFHLGDLVHLLPQAHETASPTP